jgi:uncharacterized protein (DUF1778 family)
MTSGPDEAPDAERARLVVHVEKATRFLAALDDDAPHEAGLRRLVAKPSVIAPE